MAQPTTTTPEHPALSLPARPITSPVQRTSGKATAHTIMRKIPVRWELHTFNGVTHATFTATPGNKTPAQIAGRVVEGIPGRLYYFQSREDAERGDMWGMFATAERAAEAGAVRFTLNTVRGH